jgi:hypothetical protein
MVTDGGGVCHVADALDENFSLMMWSKYDDSTPVVTPYRRYLM